MNEHHHPTERSSDGFCFRCVRWHSWRTHHHGRTCHVKIRKEQSARFGLRSYQEDRTSELRRGVLTPISGLILQWPSATHTARNAAFKLCLRDSGRGLPVSRTIQQSVQTKELSHCRFSIVPSPVASSWLVLRSREGLKAGRCNLLRATDGIQLQHHTRRHQELRISSEHG